MTRRPSRAWLPWGLALLGVLAVTAVRSASLLGYSNWIIDEEQIVVTALGFVGGDLNPRWFNYHPLPMYLLGALYEVMYLGAHLAGRAASRVEFASLLFTHDAVFYVPAKLLGSFAYTAGCAVLGWSAWRRTASRGAAALAFGAPLLLADGITTATQVRNDTFVFLFMALTVHFACFAPKRGASVVLATVGAAAAFASKIPALVLLPVLLAALAWDARRGRYPWRYVAGAALLWPVAVFVFMPYAFLDFASYWPTIARTAARVGGEADPLAKAVHAGWLARWGSLGAALYHGTGLVPVAGSLALAAWGLWRDRALGFACLFAAAYATAFATSATLDAYWLRPVYPFLLLFPVLLAAEVAALPVVQIGLKRARWARAAGALPALGGRLRALLLAAVTVAYGLTLGGNLPQAVAAAVPPGEDTRITAERWIRDHLPAGSRVILPAVVPHYLPRVFVPDPRTMLAEYNYMYPHVTQNRLLMEAFRDWYGAALRSGKRFRAVVVAGDLTDEVLGQVAPGAGDYVVLTRASYARYENPAIAARAPGVAAANRRFVAFVRRQEPVAVFEGKGPRLEIYRLKEPLPAAGAGGAPPPVR